MVRTRWEGYGDGQLFGRRVLVIGPLGGIIRGVDRGGRDRLWSRPPDRREITYPLLDIIGNPHPLRLVTAGRSSHSSRYVATYTPYASENLTGY